MPDRPHDGDSPRLAALLDLLATERLPRTGWLQAGMTQVESIASHAHGVASLALALGGDVDPPLDVDRAVALCVVHDAAEALLSDLPRSATELLPAGAKADAETAAARRLLAPLAPEAAARHAEFAEQSTREARFAKVCDRLHLGLRLLAYGRSGVRGLGRFAGVLASLDCSEFEPAERLRRELVAAVEASGALQ
ncbi:MAG: HD domain-containing protein [Planctomycetota bacterium]